MQEDSQSSEQQIKPKYSVRKVRTEVEVGWQKDIFGTKTSKMVKRELEENKYREKESKKNNKNNQPNQGFIAIEEQRQKRHSDIPAMFLEMMLLRQMMGSRNQRYQHRMHGERRQPFQMLARYQDQPIIQYRRNSIRQSNPLVPVSYIQRERQRQRAMYQERDMHQDGERDLFLQGILERNNRREREEKQKKQKQRQEERQRELQKQKQKEQEKEKQLQRLRVLQQQKYQELQKLKEEQKQRQQEHQKHKIEQQRQNESNQPRLKQGQQSNARIMDSISEIKEQVGVLMNEVIDQKKNREKWKQELSRNVRGSVQRSINQKLSEHLRQVNSEQKDFKNILLKLIQSNQNTQKRLEHLQQSVETIMSKLDHISNQLEK